MPPRMSFAVTTLGAVGRYLGFSERYGGAKYVRVVSSMTTLAYGGIGSIVSAKANSQTTK